MSQRITPLDPDSPKGREVAARASEALAAVMFSIRQRKAAALADAEQHREAS
jgi:hypothetical protein